MKPLTVNRIIYIAGFGAFILILGGYLGWSGFRLIIQKSVNDDLCLGNGTNGLRNWANLPIPLVFSVHLFNVTNPEEIQQGAKPVLNEVGPYIFNVYRSRKNITLLPNGTIFYFDRDVYIYSNTEENKSLDEEVTILNVALLGAATLVERIFPFGVSLLNEAIPFLFPNAKDMFIRAPVRNILFEGVMIQCNYTSGSAMPICNALQTRAPPTIVRDEVTKHYSFALFRHKNATLTGPYKIKDGAKDISELGQIVEVKNKQYLPYWEKNTTCSEIKGTDSTLFPPITDPKKDIFIYSPDICIPLSASYVNESYFNGVINYYRYEGSEKNFAGVDEVPENACRCTKLEDKHKPLCYKKGAFESFGCQGSPIVFSLPHFVNSDPSYSEYAKGLKPDPNKHITYVSIEPVTGVPISGKKRVQMNMFLKKIKGITLLTNVSEGLFPIGWVEEGADLHKSGIDELTKLYYLIESFKIIRWLLIVFGIILMGTALLLFVKVKRLLCFHNNQVGSEFEYGVNHRSDQGEPQKLATFNTDKTEANDDVPTITNIYPSIGNKNDVPTLVTNTTVPR